MIHYGFHWIIIGNNLLITTISLKFYIRDIMSFNIVRCYFTIALCVKEKFGNSYKDIPDEQFDEVLKYIEFLKENPS